ncbi:hypothetical protein Rwratislav_45275 [Rhodococcus wratislaviensis IFP 2016]|nr:hypothetical protein Rwratislav_45275 [Rhodococcus wratislaviensis IFP 2016]
MSWPTRLGVEGVHEDRAGEPGHGGNHCSSRHRTPRWTCGCLRPAVAGRQQFGSPPTARQDETVSDRTASDLEREFAMLAYVRDRLRASEGEDFRIPTTAVDQVLDELTSLERSPWDPT